MIASEAELAFFNTTTNHITVIQALELMTQMVRLDPKTLFKVWTPALARLVVHTPEERQAIDLYSERFVKMSNQKMLSAIIKGNALPQAVFEAIRCPILPAKASFAILREHDLDRIISKFFTVKNPSDSSSTSPGRVLEKKLVNFYQAINPDLDIRTAKHFINPHIPFISCAPDALAFKKNCELSHAVEIKTFAEKDLRDLGVGNSSFRISEDGEVTLREFGPIYHQLQVSMAVMNITEYVLLIYFDKSKQIVEMNVPYNHNYNVQVFPLLKFKFEKVILPRLARKLAELSLL